jgi:membrane-bound ClpP family serine protease
VNEAMLFWGLGLLAAGLLLVIVEVFVPSGGLIALTATGCSIAGIYCLFRYSTTWGLVGVLIMLFLGPLVFMFALKIWPSTPIGRRIMGERPPEVVEAERLADFKEREAMQSLVGAEGKVLTDLRPVGLAEIDGRRYEVLAQSSFIPAGSSIRVTVVEGNQIKVRPIA